MLELHLFYSQQLQMVNPATAGLCQLSYAGILKYIIYFIFDLKSILNFLFINVNIMRRFEGKSGGDFIYPHG
jgi:hypothetical protein